VILIIGGGIAGTATALALHKAGFDVAVYEAHPSSGADIGAFLTLADNGMRALAQLDVAEAVAAVGFPLTSMSVIADTGAEIATVPLGGHEHPLTNFRCLRRAELNAVLQAEARRRGIPIHHNARLESVEGTTAVFADGTNLDTDLLIGADGLNSTLRPQIDPDSTGPRYAGQHVYYGYTKQARPPTTPERITMIRGSGSAFGYCVSPTNETFWFARVPAGSPTAEATPQECRDRLLPLLHKDNTPAADIVAATDDELMVTNASDLHPGGRWHDGHTLIIGDAAHAASPATGQGASMALEDAVVLAKAMRDVPDNAFAAYERTRRPRVERNIAASAAATAGRPTDRGPQSRASQVDDELTNQIDWQTPLSAGESASAG
jgi:2-polyprenyl-6-methoxyphenol hydroxylase-like FAD-dependent oxidoreductase